jgi:hypothetical protein
MAFDRDNFLTQKFEPRTAEVEVKELAGWFDKDEKPVWQVRGLTGDEIAKANDVAAKRELSTAIVEGLSTMKAKEVKEAIIKLIGRADGVSEATAKRMEHLIIASIKPKCDEDLAVKINKTFPTVFLALTNQILILSGLGMLPGKSKPFGKTLKSKQP